MQQASNLIQDDAKTLVNERFFDNEAVRDAQPVVALHDIQTVNYISKTAADAPLVVHRPARNSGNSLAYILLSIFALSAAVAAFYFLPAQKQSSASAVTQDAIQDNIDDSVKPKILVSQKPIEPQPNSKTLSVVPTEKSKSAKQTERAAREVPPLTPDETEPGQWMNEDAADTEEEGAPKPKTKKREKKADNDLDDFVREIENVERQTRRIKKVLDEYGND